MSNNVIAAFGQPVGESPDQDIVRKLEEMLIRAKAGEFLAFSASMVLRRGRTGRCWSVPDEHGLAALGAMRMLEEGFTRAFYESPEGTPIPTEDGS